MSEEVDSPANDGQDTTSPIRTDVRLRRANGFRLLGMFGDADAEMDKIAEGDCLDRDVLVLKMAVRQDAEDWEGMRSAARLLRHRYPEAVEWWIADAYATRRSESIEVAREILIEGEERHADEPGFKYTLACSACRLGDSDTALRYLLAAIALDSKYKKMAFSDEDLTDMQEVLREKGLAPGDA